LTWAVVIAATSVVVREAMTVVDRDLIWLTLREEMMEVMDASLQS
jgi:hypothetical protein